MSESKQGDPSKYQTLHDRGVVLPDEIIDHIVSQLDQGSQMVKDYFKRQDNTGLHYISSDDLDSICYDSGFNAINIPINYLNGIANAGVTLKHIASFQQDIGINDYHEMISLDVWHLIAGIEDTIHHFQDIKDSHVKFGLPAKSSSDMNDLDRIFYPAEIEARALTDLILKANGRKPIWENFDNHFRQRYPEKYNI